MTYRDDYKIKRRLNTKRWRENNPEKVLKYSRLYEKRDKTKAYRKQYSQKKGSLNAKRWRDSNPEKAHNATLKYWYGITVEQYNQLFVDQKGLCAICKEQSEKRLCVDHEHDTGRIRGLLCRACNSGLGHFKENTNNFLNAIKYLTKETK